MCASPAASDKLTSASMPMVCAIHMGTRRACAGAAPFTHGADKDAQSQKVNVVSGVLSGPCAIHMGPPPDPHRTAPRPPPDTDATDLHETWDCKRNGARTSCPLWASNVHRSPRVVGGHPKRTGCPRAGSSARLRPFVHPEPVRAWPNAALVLITTSVWQAIHASVAPLSYCVRFICPPQLPLPCPPTSNPTPARASCPCIFVVNTSSTPLASMSAPRA